MNLVSWDQTLMNAQIGTHFLCQYQDHTKIFELIKVDSISYAYSKDGIHYETSRINLRSAYDVNMYLLDVIGKALEFDEDMEKLLS